MCFSTGFGFRLQCLAHVTSLKHTQLVVLKVGHSCVRHVAVGFSHVMFGTWAILDGSVCSCIRPKNGYLLVDGMAFRIIQFQNKVFYTCEIGPWESTHALRFQHMCPFPLFVILYVETCLASSTLVGLA